MPISDTPTQLPEAEACLTQLRSQFLDNNNGATSSSYPQQQQQLQLLRLLSMRESYNEKLLTRFYNEMMVSNFPLEDERDDLDDWLDYFRALNDAGDEEDKDNVIPMDVVLLLLTAPLRSDGDDTDVETTITIVAGIAYEHYPTANVGLVSYLCTHPDYRKRGVIRAMHPIAVAALADSEYVLAETNTDDADGEEAEEIAARHRILENLGYRPLEDFPYVQPPLGMDEPSFDDILLLVYHNKDDDAHPAVSSTNSIPTDTLVKYVTNFYTSVYGTDRTARAMYHLHWYYRLLMWYAAQHQRATATSVAIIAMKAAAAAPWTNDATQHWQRQWNRHHKHVVVVGAGCAGLATALDLARRYLDDDNDEDRTSGGSSPPPNKYPLTITVVEAQSYVGGRIRTVLTNNDDDDDDDDDDENYITDERIIEKCRTFAPWPVPMGAEFVHGVDSTLTEILMRQRIPVQETFDLSPSCGGGGEGDDDDCNGDHNDQHPAVERLSQAQRDYRPVRIFGKGRMWDLREISTAVFQSEDHHTDEKKNGHAQQQHSFAHCVARARQLWDEVVDIAENFYGTSSNNIEKGGGRDWSSLPPDVSLDAFVRERLGKDDEDDDDDGDIETILLILEAMYAHTAATGMEQFGLHEASREEYMWDYSERNFRTQHVFADLISYYLREVERINDEGNGLVCISIRTDCPVIAIRDAAPEQADPVSLCLQGGEMIMCDKTVVTAPLAILKAGLIAFEGAYSLPKEKRLALETIQMFSGMKVHVLLRAGTDIPSIIPEELQQTEILFCPGEFCTQIWFRRNENSVFVTGFVPANARDRWVNAVSNGASAKKLILGQLTRMYPNLFSVDSTKQQPSCSALAVHDWSDDKYIGGLYSSPSVGAGWRKKKKEKDDGDDVSTTRTTILRDALAEPIHDKVFFAGEHTNCKTCASVQAAIESGLRASEEVWTSLS